VETYLLVQSLYSKVLTALAVLAIGVLVLLPSFYLFTFIVLRWSEVYTEIFNHPLIGNTYLLYITRYLFFSFKLALTALIVDLLLGIPVAYILVKKNFPGKGILENLVLLPLVIPTSGFGFATLIAWTAIESLPVLLGIRIRVDTLVPVVNIPALMLIVHVTLTFPYIVKTVSAALRDLEKGYEIVSESLGASPLTTFRKVIFPLILPGIFSGSVLAFARSLGETGATMVVAGVTTTASIAIVKWELEGKLAPAAFLGALLVAAALAVILPVEYFLGRKKRVRGVGVPKELELKVVSAERKFLSKLSFVKDAVSLLFLFIVVVMPIISLVVFTVKYWSADPYTGRPEGGILYQLYGPPNYSSLITRSLTTSLIVATASTLISLYLAVVTIMVIEKTRLGRVLRALLKIPLVVPTSALGLSMVLLWGPLGLSILRPSIWLTILTHIVFSVPVIVETGLASYEELEVELYEETARTLGANPYDVLETVSIPMIKRGLVAGGLLAFTHSLGETGATFLVMGDHITISTLVVNLVEALAIPTALFASTLLILFSLVLLTLASLVSK